MLNIKNMFRGEPQQELDYAGRVYGMPITSIVIANSFLKKAMSENVKITPSKLQKLVYFYYATYLKATGIKLFGEPFEVSEKGPVLPYIDAKFGSYNSSAIKTFAKDAKDYIFSLRETGISKKCLDTVWGKYKNLSDRELIKLICKEDTAYTKAINRGDDFLDDTDIYLDGTEIIYEYLEEIHQPKRIKNKNMGNK